MCTPGEYEDRLGRALACHYRQRGPKCRGDSSEYALALICAHHNKHPTTLNLSFGACLNQISQILAILQGFLQRSLGKTKWRPPYGTFQKLVSPRF